eukprot:scaffold8098_cov239-Pinguiococcus_pyrenoidosus.AAC.1
MASDCSAASAGSSSWAAAAAAVAMASDAADRRPDRRPNPFGRPPLFGGLLSGGAVAGFAMRKASRARRWVLQDGHCLSPS